eukprot:CAMPEP_0184309992 /NCGR_PEP_ID=MMETSP1049-20130417/21920_1 /TAXON_ID=77928 /ORGANISM="Proteomonas sulcata, Strain CCMP704" /LENGTH=32 /DNA_ID= /DNA_START= /DNA_END= /DNA_ORIENTATION=
MAAKTIRAREIPRRYDSQDQEGKGPDRQRPAR